MLDKFEQWGIDEAFLDVSDKVKDYAEAEALARQIKAGNQGERASYRFYRRWTQQAHRKSCQRLPETRRLNHSQRRGSGKIPRPLARTQAALGRTQNRSQTQRARSKHHRRLGAL